MCPQPPLQVRVDFGDVLDGHQVFGDVPAYTAWLSQPRWQERLDLSQRVREAGQGGEASRNQATQAAGRGPASL